MAIVKKRNEQIVSSLLLESNEPLDLPPAEVDEKDVTLQYEQFRPFLPELLEELREGAYAEPVPVIKDGSTFAIHGETRTFWVKIWHQTDSDMIVIERAQMLNCLPRTKAVRVSFGEDE
jgi:hypothetical protein